MLNYRRSALLTFLAIPLGILAERNFRKLPRLPVSRVPSYQPSLSIIIPARDEAHNLGVILPSLLNIDYPGEQQILVVDDHSSDNSAQVAETFGVQLLSLVEDLPQNWKGKPYTCHQGAMVAKGEWLLFTDADTIHSRLGISSAVAYAVANKLDGLSLFIKHQNLSWIDGITLDVAFAGLFSGWSAANHMLNGQFILVRREVYFDSGGFAAVGNEVLEDVALGNWLQSRGYRLQLLAGDQVARVHMYASQKQMFYGLTRLGAGSLRWQGLRAVLTALHITAIMSPLVALLGGLLGKLSWFWVPATWSVSSLSILPWSRRSANSFQALFAPLGALIVLVASLFGLINRLSRKGIPWKGRRV
ncbi:MAG: glycosyltransferase [Chloroflexota bacterium]|nr:MAG: glycosyltransferase [Chloroflexota bacterium]